jgi:hypothetical protein
VVTSFILKHGTSIEPLRMFQWLSRTAIRGAYRADERATLLPLIEAARLPEAQAASVLAQARTLAQEARTRMRSHGGSRRQCRPAIAAGRVAPFFSPILY